MTKKTACLWNSDGPDFNDAYRLWEGGTHPQPDWHWLNASLLWVCSVTQVSEAHLLSSLSPRCQHLIMIGDHQQLRPSYTNYDLTVRHHQHHIDISMFERLCRAGVPFQRLSLQHRWVLTCRWTLSDRYDQPIITGRQLGRTSRLTATFGWQFRIYG